MSKGHAVIDGSNLATEGRSEPSLKQLNEAVDAIADEYDFAQITVIVDATFEHRVSSSETKSARKAIDDNKIITPPAGVIGRGDAFILQVADRAKAVVFSNDSFQEFHASYEWLFDDGRLIGGKPIPAVGWIYVPRSPVRGPVSRRVTADKRRATKPSDKPKPKTAETPTPEPAERATKPSRRRGAKKPATTQAPAPAATGDGTNDRAAWKSFKADYPVGSTIAATVDRFSSHGAYGSVDNVVIYLPNRLLGSPAPTKARDVVDLGATMDFIVDRYDDERLGIDAGLIAASSSGRRPAGKRTAKKRVATPLSPSKSPARKTAAKKPVAKAATKKTVTRRPPAKKAVAKKTAARRAPAKKAVAKAATKKTVTRRPPAKKAVAKKTAARRAPAKKAVAKKAVKKRR